MYFFLKSKELSVSIQHLQSKPPNGQDAGKNGLLKTGFRKPLCKTKPESILSHGKFKRVFWLLFYIKLFGFILRGNTHKLGGSVHPL